MLRDSDVVQPPEPDIWDWSKIGRMSRTAAHRMIGRADRADEEDVAQMGTIDLYRRFRDAATPVKDLEGYVFVTVRRQCQYLARARLRRPHEVSLEGLLGTVDEPCVAPESPAIISPERLRTRVALEELERRATALQREVMELVAAGQGVKEVASHVGRSPRQIRAVLRALRARAQRLLCLDECGLPAIQAQPAGAVPASKERGSR